MKNVQFLKLEVEKDFKEGQNILDLNRYTRDIDVESAYNDRVKNNFEGTYIVNVERISDYERFIDILEKEKRSHYMELNKKFKEEFKEEEKKYRNDEINRNELDDDELLKEVNCTCKLCSDTLPTFEEWKTGKTLNGQKLGKKLRKNGVNQEILDFYSQQIKEESKTYFTISGLPQHIAGMSYYCELGTWDGMKGSSCQDTRHENEDYPVRLGGSLHDNKLFVGMLHDNLEDLEDMTDKLKARTIFRLVHIDDEPCLVATSYYGNNKTKGMLKRVLESLNSFNIFGNEFLGHNRHRERANGIYTMYRTDDIYVCEEFEEWQYVACPCCGGDGYKALYSHRMDRYIDAKCPACSGNGSIETLVTVYVDEYVEVEEEEDIYPYNECYEHYRNYIEIGLKLDDIKKVLEENGKKKAEV